MNELEPCHCGYQDRIPEEYKPFRRGALVEFKKPYEHKRTGVMEVVAHPVFFGTWQVPVKTKAGMVFCSEIKLAEEEKTND